MSECALGTKPNAEGSCLSKDHLVLITHYTGLPTLKKVKEVTDCKDDACVVQKANIPEEKKEQIKREAFKAPVESNDHSYWLNNTQIDTIMSQLRLRFPGFAHGFIHMIDLEAFKPTNVNSFDYPVIPAPETNFPKEIKAGLVKQGVIGGSLEGQAGDTSLSTHNDAPLKSYGIVCNTDSSKGSGQHWFALYISTDQKDPEDTSKKMITIELFNSAGGGTVNEDFNAFWNQQALAIAKETGLRCVFNDKVTTIQHQSNETGNCGAYSLFYIYCRLQGVSPEEFNNPQKPVSDYSMQKFRGELFKVEEAMF